MTDPRRPVDDRAPPASKLNPTTLALIAGVVLLVALAALLLTRGNGDQDKLTNPQVAAGTAGSPDKVCASKSTYDLIKRDLFRRAAQLRGNDQAAFDSLSASAVVRMDNPVMESGDSTSGAVNCSGALSLDLPPGVTAVGGRHSLTADVDYTVQPAADGSGRVVLLRNADAIVTPLATLTRTETPQAPPVATLPGQPPVTAAPPELATQQPAPPSAYPGRPSFDCAAARTNGEIAVCSDPGLSALDVNMAAQYRRAFAAASPDERDLLRSTGARFSRYRDGCRDARCIGDAYTGRMREIRDIVDGNWQPPH